MIIYNFKINGSKVFKCFLFIVMTVIIIMVSIVFYRLLYGSKKDNSSCINSNEISKIYSYNYTNVLKTVHENIEKYVGQIISFSGYVYRVSDLKDNQFILARDMIISSDNQSVIVGFLCEYDNIKNIENNTWVQITGTITKGTYHGDMPIIKIIDLKKINKPNDEYVYPPDSSYIQTDKL